MLYAGWAATAGRIAAAADATPTDTAAPIVRSRGVPIQPLEMAHRKLSIPVGPPAGRPATTRVYQVAVRDQTVDSRLDVLRLAVALHPGCSR